MSRFLSSCAPWFKRFLQGLQKLACHELCRVFRDRLVGNADRRIFDSILETAAEKNLDVGSEDLTKWRFGILDPDALAPQSLRSQSGQTIP